MTRTELEALVERCCTIAECTATLTGLSWSELCSSAAGSQVMDRHGLYKLDAAVLTTAQAELERWFRAAARGRAPALLLPAHGLTNHESRREVAFVLDLAAIAELGRED